MTMTPKLLCRVLAAFVFLVFAVPASNAQDGTGLSPETGMAEARTLMKDGRFDEALALLRPLALDHPEITNIHFLAALAAIEASRRPGVAKDDRDALLDEAIAALHGILVGQPGLVRVRLELARAFFLKGADGLAREHFERVLAGEPVAAVAANIGRFLNAIRARRRWSGSFGFSFAPDSNIGAVSEEEIIYINGLPFRRDADTSATSGIGVALWGGGEYQHPLNDRLRLRAGANGSRREYTGNDFDQTLLSAHAGPRWLVRRDTEVSLLASARQRWLASQPHSRELGVRLETGYRFAPRLRLSGRASWHERNFRRDTHLDGPVWDFSLGAAAFLTPLLRLDGAAGYARERPDTITWRNSSRWLRLGASIALPRGFTLGGGAELRQRTYEGNWFPFTVDGSPREDRVRILSVSVFNRAFTFRGFSPQLSLVNEERKSTAQLYDYSRTRAELRFVRQF